MFSNIKHTYYVMFHDITNIEHLEYSTPFKNEINNFVFSYIIFLTKRKYKEDIIQQFPVH